MAGRSNCGKLGSCRCAGKSLGAAAEVDEDPAGAPPPYPPLRPPTLGGKEKSIDGNCRCAGRSPLGAVAAAGLSTGGIGLSSVGTENPAPPESPKPAPPNASGAGGSSMLKSLPGWLAAG